MAEVKHDHWKIKIKIKKNKKIKKKKIKIKILYEEVCLEMNLGFHYNFLFGMFFLPI